MNPPEDRRALTESEQEPPPLAQVAELHRPDFSHSDEAEQLIHEIDIQSTLDIIEQAGGIDLPSIDKGG